MGKAPDSSAGGGGGGDDSENVGCARAGKKKKKRILIALIAIILVVVAVVVGAVVGTSKSRNNVSASDGTSITASSSAGEDAASTGEDTVTFAPSVAATIDVNDPTPAPVAVNDEDSSTPAPVPTEVTPPTSNVSEGNPTLAPSTSAPTSPSSVGGGTAAPSAALQVPVTVGNGRIARYQINWSQSHRDCELKSYTLTAACPVGLLDLNADEKCLFQSDDKSLKCNVSPTDTLQVACYGLTEQDILLDVAVSSARYECSERTQTVEGAVITSSVSGNVFLEAEIILMGCTDPNAISMSCTPYETLKDPPGCKATGSCNEQTTCTTGTLQYCLISCYIEVEAGRIASVESIQSDCIEPFDFNTKSLGDACLYNMQCESNVCSYNVCQEPLPDWSSCEESHDCLNQTCAYKDASYSESLCCPGGESFGSICLSTAENGALCDSLSQVCVSGACGMIEYIQSDADDIPRLCCSNGTFTYREKVWHDFHEYCYNEAPTGGSCGPNVANLCQSGVCSSGVCQQGLLSAGEPCDNGADCQSGACGLIEYIQKNSDGVPRQCCVGTESFAYREKVWHDYHEYCSNEAPAGGSCGPNVADLCQSGICAGGVCKEGLLSVGETCDNGADCQSGACGLIEYIQKNTDGVPRQCCTGSESFTFREKVAHDLNEYCFNEAPAGGSCGPNVADLCESGICANGVCE